MTTSLDPNWTAFTGKNRLHLSEDCLNVANPSDCLSRGIASDCVTSGRAYFEAKCVVSIEGGHCCLGWSNDAMNGHFLGYSSDSEKWKNSSDYKKWGNGFTSPYGVTFGENDIIGCYLDIDERTISFSLNGVSQGVAFSGTDLYDSESDDPCKLFYPAYYLCDASAEFNFGASPFVHSPGDFHSIVGSTAPKPFPKINETRDGDKNTVLHTAVCDHNCEFISTLLKCGADVESRNHLGRTPLHTALTCKKYDIALLLVESGRASIFSLCNYGYTPVDGLFYSPKFYSQDIVRSYRWPRRKHFVHFLYFCKLIILSDSRRINNLVSVDAKGKAGAGALGLDWDYEDLFRQNGVYPQWIVGAGQEDTAARYCELIKYSKHDHNSNSRKIAPKAAAAGTAAIDSMSDVICGVQQIKVSVCATGGRAAMSVLRQDSLICMIASYL